MTSNLKLRNEALVSKGVMNSFSKFALWIALMAQMLATPMVAQYSQTNPNGAVESAAEAGKFSLSGTVVNEVTGAPVRRAMVQIVGQDQAALTDADGHFEFTGVAGGRFAVIAHKPGFLDWRGSPQDSASAPIQIANIGPETPAVVLRLTPDSVITGKITSDGEPVESIRVKAIVGRIRDGFWRWERAGMGISDEDGEFRIANLGAGTYYLEVGPSMTPAPAPAGSKAHEGGFDAVFYPGAPESGAGLVVGAGQRVEVELPLKLEPWYRVRGTVQLLPGTNGAVLWMANASGHRLEQSQADPTTGAFEMKAPQGRYTLEARTYGTEDVFGAAKVGLNVNSDLNGVRVALGTLPEIAVRVKMEAMTTQGGQVQRQLERRPGNNPFSLWFQQADYAEQAMTPFYRNSTSNAQAVRNLEPGVYWVTMGANPPWYVQSAQCGNVNLLREKLTVGASAPCAEIDVVLRDDAASLSVSGTWEGDVAQAMVLLMPERAPLQAREVPLSVRDFQAMQMRGGMIWNPAMATAPLEKNHPMTIEQLPPGDYNVLLVDRADGLEYTNPDAMSAYLSKAQHVTLTPNQQASVNLELIRVGR